MSISFFFGIVLLGDEKVHIKIGKKKIEVEVANTFWKRLKGFLFVLEPIQTGLCFPHCRSIHTYLMCQPIDVVMTDKDYTILYLYPKLKSEKIIFPKRKVYYSFELPVGCCEKLKVGDKLTVLENEKKEPDK